MSEEEHPRPKSGSEKEVEKTKPLEVITEKPPSIAEGLRNFPEEIKTAQEWHEALKKRFARKHRNN